MEQTLVKRAGQAKAPAPAVMAKSRLAKPAGGIRLGRADDSAERQADHIAERVLQRASANAIPTPASAAAPKTLHRTAQNEAPPLEKVNEQDPRLPEALEERMLDLTQGGQPMPDAVRREMEHGFGMDLTDVRIHTDQEAAQLNEAVGAHAFALGEHIAFNRGRFQPEQPAGKKLLAHELAHVAQHRAQTEATEATPVRRGFWGDLYDRAANTLGDIADWAWDKVREYGWRLLESIAPEFARTVRAIADEGILPWLGRQVSRAWDGFIGGLRALVPFEGPRQLIDLFAGLVERAAAIAAALISGDCEPLMQAIGAMKSFVVETVGVAWDNLVEFLRPVGEFFTNLWDSFGAPAVQWLRDFAGDVWEGIQNLGRRFWEWIRPVREAAERVWNWFKDLLFGSGEGDSDGGSEGGVLGWISRKAGEAWDWVKEQTAPVWRPVAEFAGKVAELIPPAFVREMGESAQQLSTQLEATGEGMNGGDGVAQNRDTLASVLPSVENIIAAVRRIIVGAGAWLTEKIGALAEGVNGLIARLNANALLSWLGAAFGWLAEGVNTLLSWAREKVSGLFQWLVQGFDALTPFLQLVLETIRKLIAIAGDLLQLPLLILNSIWQRVPACIREPIENFIQTQILARIPVFGQFFSDPELWPRVRDTALRILRRIFVDGDLPGAAWLFFQSILRILGLPPELVVQVLAKAAGAIGAILTNPIGFIINTLRAMGAGFMRFFGNIGTHLLEGLTGWLFGTLREAGITPPADFSLGSILGFVLQVLGVTADNIFNRLSERIGPEATARLRRMLDVATGVWSFIATLINEGPAGLWRELTERLSNLWDVVVQGVTGFITERVIGWATRWLVSLLDVTGIMPVINTLIAIYRAIESFMQYLRELLQIVSRVLDGVLGIARGAIDEAAGFLEDALARALPVAIGFLANQAGLGRLSERLREILGSVQDRVNAAIDWLIDRAIRFGQAVLNMARQGAAAVGRGVARLRDWWRGRREFRSATGEPHSVFIQGQGRDAHVMIASETTPYAQFIERVTVPAENQADKQQALVIARELDQAIVSAAGDNPAPGPAAQPSTVDHAAIIDGLLGRLAETTSRFMPVDPAQSSDPVYGPRVNGFGSSANVFRLTPIHRDGSSPSSGDMGNPTWGKLNKRKQGEGVYYIKGHLLNENLGGPGNTWDNLTPLTQAANSDHKNNFENAVKQAVNGSTGEYTQPTPAQVQQRNLKSVNFVVTARYGQPARPNDVAYLRNQGNPDLNDVADIVEGEQAIPVALDCHAHELTAAGRPGPAVAGYTVNNRIDDDLDHYATRPTPKQVVYLNEMPQVELLRLNGIGETLAAAIIAGRPFRTRAELQEKTHIADGRWNQMQGTPGVEVRIYRR